MQDNKRPQENERTVRDALHSRAFKNGAYASVLCAVMLALVVALNLFVGALPAKYLRYDMTENKLYSLSQETEDLCAALTQDVTFYYLGRTGQEDAAVTELLDKYKDASSHIQVVQKDPVLYPTFGAAYDAADAAVGSIIAVCGERYRVVDAGDLYTYTPNYQTYTYDTEFDGEGALTSALSYVASEEAPLLYTLSGHGEAGLSATLTDGAERQNMSFETLALLTADAVPEDAAAVVLNAPTKDISAEEAERLRTYLAGGGSLDIRQRSWFNPNFEFQWFFLPNLIGMLSFMLGLVVTGLSIAREREAGTFDQLLVSPATPTEIALAKLIPGCVVGLAHGTIFLLVSVFGFGVPFTGSVVLLYVAIFIFSLAAGGIGLMISSLSSTQQQAFLGAFTVGVPCILLSGAVTPVINMPMFLQHGSQLNPIRHFTTLVQGVFLRDITFEAASVSLLKICAITVVCVCVAVWMFRRRV